MDVAQQPEISTADVVSTLAGSVKPYHRHVLVCTGVRGAWPPRLEEADGLLGRMARDVRDRREGSGPIPKLTATDEPSRGEGLDLLVFPEAVRYVGVDEGGWEAVLAEHVIGGNPTDQVRREPLPGRWVFVCVHGARDERCGLCGPGVLAALETACRAAGLDDVTVRATSHVGGHKYAGNVIVYPEGIWYGTVTPAEVPSIVSRHLREGALVEELLRGAMLPLGR